ncbi:ABC transporter permease [Amycolatopsis sp. NPDC098790]|uniref:ABC transporter permease n=1 Tax=Amycolatopsis sp. NPDC098790 TaxID=3363939 RepID=UPI0037F1FA24
MATVAVPGEVRAGVWARLGRPSPLVIVAIVVAAFVAVLVLAGSWLAPHDPGKQNLLASGAPPGDGHLFGTDSLGRDVLSQVMAGAGTAVAGPAIIALGTVIIGAMLGILAGYRGGAVDAVISRFADLMYALPGLVVIIVLVGVVGGGYWFAAIVLTVLMVPGEIRLCRSATLVQARLPYVEAARTLGLSGSRIMFRHIVLNIMPTIIATLLLDFVSALIALSGLSYLGLGVPPGTPDWGALLQDGQSLLAVNPWLSLAPAIMIILTATSVTIIGDWMYDRFTERSEQR